MNLARAMHEGFKVVRDLGNTITPAPAVAVSYMPTAMAAALPWVVSRLAGVRKGGVAGPGEPKHLIDAMCAAAPGDTPALVAVRSYL